MKTQLDDLKIDFIEIFEILFQKNSGRENYLRKKMIKFQMGVISI